MRFEEGEMTGPDWRVSTCHLGGISRCRMGQGHPVLSARMGEMTWY